MTEYVKIIRQNKTLSGLANKQIGVETAADVDLGYCAWGGKDANGHITRWLAAREPGLLTTLKLSGGSTTGSVGLLQHDTNGLISGGINSWADFTTIITDAPSGGEGGPGTGTPGTLPIWATTSTLGDSAVTQSGTLIRVNAAATSHTLSHGIITPALEVNTAAYIDGVLNTYGQHTADNDINLLDMKSVTLGTGIDAVLRWDTVQSPDTLLLGLGADSNTLIVSRKADMTTNFDYPLRTDPTIFIRGAGVTSNEYLAISDGLIETGAGTPFLRLNIAGGAGSIYAGSVNMYSGVTYSVGVGNTVVVANSYTMALGRDLTVGGVYNAVFGRGHTVANDGNLVGGIYHSISGSYNLIGGANNGSVGDYPSLGLIYGELNLSNFDHTTLSGKEAKALWSYGRFFATGKLAVTGDVQGFDGVFLRRHTASKVEVELTSTGSGASPLLVPIGSMMSFLVVVGGSYEGGDGLEAHAYLVLAVHTPANGVVVYSVEMANPTFGASLSNGCGQVRIWANASGNSVGIFVTPESAAPMNWFASITAGGMCPSGYLAPC